MKSIVLVMATVFFAPLAACADDSPDLDVSTGTMDAQQQLELCNWSDESVDTYHDACVPVVAGDRMITTWRNVIEIAAANLEVPVNELLRANPLIDSNARLPDQHGKDVEYGVYFKPPKDRKMKAAD